jgi:hypothetical protein
MSSHSLLPPLGVLTEIVEPTGSLDSPSIAKELLSLHLKEDAKERIRQLLLKKNAGTITPSEQSTLEEYLVTGELIDLLHAKARRTIQASDAPAT